MFRGNKRDEALDRLAEGVVRAGGVGEDQSDSLASSPFLFAQVTARIARDASAEQRARAGAESAAGWLLTFLVARRAIPGLALLAAVSACALWVTSKGAPPVAGVPDPPDVAVRLVATGGTCALSNTAECAISDEEVLATMFSQGEVPR